MRWNKISDAVIRRLPLYLRVLDDLAQEQNPFLRRNSVYVREWGQP
jgi:NADH/NAD ratio-sensing transcriptional regulator Rex